MDPMKITELHGKTEQALYEYISGMEIIDSHEHLPPEKVFLEDPADALTLVAHYLSTDFRCAGMTTQQYSCMTDASRADELEKRFGLFEKYWPYVRYGSYARAMLIALKEFYGEDDLTRDNYVEVGEKVRALRQPGVYERVLGEKCNIKLSLTQHGRTDYQDDPRMLPVMNLKSFTRLSHEFLTRTAESFGTSVRSLSDLREVLRALIGRWKEEGIVGLKTSALNLPEPDIMRARDELRTLLSSPGTTVPYGPGIETLVVHWALEAAADLDLVVAVHAGVWGDFRRLDAQNFIPVFAGYPDVRFDLYHAGIPSVLETGIIGKNNPNVWLNLCWTHIVGFELMRRVINEWLDLVPVNKIIGFGGDYRRPVEKVYGHLVLARLNISRVLAERVDNGWMSIDEAKEIMRLWMREVPERLYGLS